MKPAPHRIAADRRRVRPAWPLPAGAVGIARQRRGHRRPRRGRRAAVRCAALRRRCTVVADDGVALHVEVDEPADFGGAPGAPTTT